MSIRTPPEGQAHRSRPCLAGGGRPLILMAIVAILLPLLAGRASAYPARAGSEWTASASLFTLSHGKWRPATSVQSLGELRGELTVRGQGAAGSSVKATMQVMHLSWEGFKKVVLPPTVSMRMQRSQVSRGTAVFTVDVQMPTLLPVYWSIVRFTVSDGHSRVEVRSGVMVGGPARRASFNTLSVPQAHAFCAARPPLRSLPYAVYLHGYFVPIITMGDGPSGGIVLDRPRHVSASILRDRSYAHGVFVRGLGLPREGWHTAPGFLDCGNGKPLGFGAST
jgi:hypothetical protein